ncbi:unnamed protein product, partial [Cylicostephanus goldi]
ARANWKDGFAAFGVNLGRNKVSTDDARWLLFQLGTSFSLLVLFFIVINRSLNHYISARVDYEIGINHFAPYCDYLVINISSPNTPGLRSMQRRADLEQLLLHTKYVLDHMKLETPPKMLLKIAPDLIDSEKKDIAKVVLNPKYGIDGLIVSNTTISRPASLVSDKRAESGGLSGAPLRQMSTECVREMYKYTKGQIPIVGCGVLLRSSSPWVSSHRKSKLHDSLVLSLMFDFLCASYLFSRGFFQIKRELAELLIRDGFTNVSEAVGADHRVKR